MSPPANLLYLLQDGKQVGPFPAEAIRSMIESGTVSPDDLTWYEGLPEWRSLSTLFPGVRPLSESDNRSKGSASDPYPREESYGSLLMDAFSYPFRGDGTIILVLGAFFFSIIGGISSMGGMGRLVLLKSTIYLQLFYYGYLASMLQQILNGSGMGESVLPKWPEFTDWQGDIIDPALKWIGTMALVLGPGLALLIFGLGAQAVEASGPGVLPGVITLLVGLFYLPMAFMLVGMFDTLLALNPVVGFRSIFAIFGHYVLTCLVLALMVGMNIATGKVGDLLPVGKDGNLAISFVFGAIAAVIDGFNRLYTLVVFARMLGCLYRVNRDKLGWF